MPSVNRPADGVEAFAKIIRGMKHQIEDLERRTKKLGRPTGEEVIPIANAGAMSAGRSTPFPTRNGGQVVAVVITTRPGAPASANSTFKLRVDGTLVGSTITLLSGHEVVNGYAGNVRVSAGAVIELECLTAGSGLADIGGYIAMKG